MLNGIKTFYARKKQLFREKVCAPVVFFLMDLVGFQRHLPFTHTGEAAQGLIRDRLSGDKPCMIARIGCTEIRNMEGSLHENGTLFQKLKWRLTMHQTGQSKKLQWMLLQEKEVDSAFVDRFTRLMMDDIEELDVFAAWRWEESEIFKAPYKFDVIGLGDLEPFFARDPWTTALKGRKVLVIQPFVNEIRAQYARKAKLFKNPDLLPDFQLLTYMPFFQGLRDAPGLDWFERLDIMKREISEIDFEIALIAAGPYGFSLAAHIKRMGRKAIVVGGALQILFGIRGARWDAIKGYQDLFNEYWIRPGEKSKPDYFRKVDGGCYW